MTEWLIPEWTTNESVRSVCTTRTGGVSKAPFDELNLATHVDDQVHAVTTNRARLASNLRLPATPVWLNQVHSNIVVELGAGVHLNSTDAPVTADGGFTRDEGVVLAILVADCLPILLASRRSREIAILHAGWQGLANGVIKNGVEQFHSQDLDAWIGPGIGPCHYEVDGQLKDKFPDEFLLEGKDSEHWMLDLQGVAARQLKILGVEHVYQSNECTYCHPERFYSFRRDGITGRIAALIWME
jgi:polyphenol oxidase